MKIIKLSSIFLLSLFFISAFIPHASAKHYKTKSRSSFGLSFNFAPVQAPNYVAYQPNPSYVAYQPAPNYVAYNVNPAPVAAMPYAPVVTASAPAYYAYPVPVQQQVFVERPRQQSVYVVPQLSYSYWRY